MELVGPAIAVAVLGMLWPNTRWAALGAVALLTSRWPLQMLLAIALCLGAYLVIRYR